MNEGITYTVLIYTCCDIVSYSFYSFIGIPIATPIPAVWRIVMSLPPSPKAIHSSKEIPRCFDICFNAFPLSAPCTVISVKFGCQRADTQCGIDGEIAFSSSSLKKGVSCRTGWLSSGSTGLLISMLLTPKAWSEDFVKIGL